MKKQGDQSGQTINAPRLARPTTSPQSDPDETDDDLPDISADGPVAASTAFGSASRQSKGQQVIELDELLRGSHSFILTEYRGLTVAQMARLREQIRTEATLEVVKNTLLRIAVANAGVPKVTIAGPTAVTFVHGETQKVAAVLSAFAKNNPNFGVKLGVVEGVVLSQPDIEHLAALPSRAALLSQIAASLRRTIARPATDVQIALSKPLNLVREVMHESK